MIKKLIKHAVYYISVPLLFCLYMALFSLLIPNNASIAVVVVRTYLFLFSLPVITVILMRFSTLPWVIDPFAAAELPITLLASMILTSFKRSGDLSRAFAEIRIDLSDDGGMGYIVFSAWFVLALICTFSLRRPKGDGLTDRIINFFTKNELI